MAEDFPPSCPEPEDPIVTNTISELAIQLLFVFGISMGSLTLVGISEPHEGDAVPKEEKVTEAPPQPRPEPPKPQPETTSQVPVKADDKSLRSCLVERDSNLNGARAALRMTVGPTTVLVQHNHGSTDWALEGQHYAILQDIGVVNLLAPYLNEPKGVWLQHSEATKLLTEINAQSRGHPDEKKKCGIRIKYCVVGQNLASDLKAVRTIDTFITNQSNQNEAVNKPFTDYIGAILKNDTQTVADFYAKLAANPGMSKFIGQCPPPS